MVFAPQVMLAPQRLEFDWLVWLFRRRFKNYLLLTAAVFLHRCPLDYIFQVMWLTQIFIAIGKV